ncbi:hypothetical protein GS457_19305 [Rhodococcus hoagii]|nr:hypothetical protein [Prescottella equi]MBM4573662.1 hypothetical protein [Prescottella equi]NKZ65678.1 hypothetical protein [Prescottella equi]
MENPSMNMPPPGYAPYPAMPEQPMKQKNTIGLIAVITAAAGFVFACIPGALIVGWVLLPIAFILGIVGLCQSGKVKGTSIAAVIVAVVGTIVGFIVFFAVVTDAVDDAFSESDLSAVEPNSGGGSVTSGNNEGAMGSRENPLPIGAMVVNNDWNIVLGTPREAGSEVSAENQFNDAPKPGMEFWIVPVTATYTGDDTGTAWVDLTIKFVGSDNKAYSDRCGVIPDNLNDVDEVYPGGVAEGNTCVAVPAGADGLWSVSAGFTGKPSFFTAR